jgi:hypothetical protein
MIVSLGMREFATLSEIIIEENEKNIIKSTLFWDL